MHDERNRTRFCTFYLGDLCLGMPVEEVQEVICYQRMTRVPLAPKEVSGLINLRGEIVTAVDLRKRLGMDDRAPGHLPMNVVLRDGDEGAVSLLVDDLGDVLDVEPDNFEVPPDTIDRSTRELIKGVYKRPECLLLVLDIDKALEPASLASPPRERCDELDSPSIQSATNNPGPEPRQGHQRVRK